MKTLLSTLLIFSLTSSICLGINLRLMTGDPQGTYYQIGQEIASQTEKVGIHLEVLPSQGSWQNIVALFNNDTEFAIFQIDAFMRAGKNLYSNLEKNIHEEIKVVMPLFHEEIHVIKAADSHIDFTNRNNFTISCGPENSGSCLSANAIADFYGKNFTYVYSNYDEALQRLQAGDIDLVIVTAGKPSKLLTGQKNLDLVSLPESQKAVNLYLYTTITQEDYPWLKEPANTYSVRSVLATMIQEQQGLANNIVGTVHFSIQVNEQSLRNEGHPKWKDVLFKGFPEGLAHKGVLNSIGACNVIQSFGYHCKDLAASREGLFDSQQPY